VSETTLEDLFDSIDSISVDVNCPFCGTFETSHSLDDDLAPFDSIKHCSKCNRDYVIQVKLSATIKYFTCERIDNPSRTEGESS